MAVQGRNLLSESGANRVPSVRLSPLGSVWFQAGFLRSEALKVGYDPLDNNVHHGEVWGNFTRGRRSRLLNTAEWFVEIEGVDLHVG